MDPFLKILKIQFFSKVLYMGMSLCSPLKFSICDICHMFCAILVDLYYTKFIYILSKFYTVRSFDYRWNNNLTMFLYKRNICFILENLLNLVSFLRHFLVNICTAMQQSCFYVDSTFIFNEISTLKQHWVIDIEST